MARMSFQDISDIIDRAEGLIAHIDEFNEDECPQEINDFYCLLVAKVKELEDLDTDSRTINKISF